jgi:hypothetical protein
MPHHTPQPAASVQSIQLNQPGYNHLPFNL